MNSQFSNYVSPEQLLRLSAAFATICGGNIAVATDSPAAASAAKNAAMAGIALTGCGCMDFGVQPLPATRMGIRFYELSGGVHIISEENAKKLRVVFIAANGIEVDENTKRAIGKIFETGAYIEAEKVKETIPLTSYKYYYLRDAIHRCHLRKLEFNVLLNVKNATIQGLLTSALKELGCAYKLDCDVMDLGCGGKKFGEKVQSGNFDMGVYINSGGEKFVLFDKNGKLINRDIMDCIFAMIVLCSAPFSTYYARNSAPSALDTLAKRFGGLIKRTNSPEIERGLSVEADFPLQFILEFDAIGGFIKLLDFLMLEEISLETLLARVPKFYMCHSNVECENVDKIIKKISENEGADSLNGAVKIKMKKGCVIVIARAENDMCEIVCESETEEYAEELAADYKKLIRDIK